MSLTLFFDDYAGGVDCLTQAKLANWERLSECHQVENLELARSTRLSFTVRHVLNSSAPKEAGEVDDSRCTEENAALRESATARVGRAEQLVSAVSMEAL